MVKTYTYERGTWNGTTFTAGASPNCASRISVVTAVSSGNVAGKSTKEVTLRDERALVVRTELYVWPQSSWGYDWVLASWTNYGYNFAGLPTSRMASNGATYSATYDGLLKVSETDESGITTNFLYDAAGRVQYATRAGATATVNGVSRTVGSVTTRMTYDALGNVLEQRIGWGQSEQLVTTKTYDDAGRLVAERSPGLGMTVHAYDVANRINTTTRPDGSTIIETKSIDGRLVSRAGTAVVAEHHTYGADSTTGRRWEQVNIGTAASSRWKKSWKDWLGRDVQSQSPGFGTQPVMTTQMFYNDVAGASSTGHLIKTTKPGVAPTLVDYDALGRAFRTCLDVNNNNTIDFASSDRITDTDQYFESSGGLCLRTDTKAYPTMNSTASVVTSSKRLRISNFPVGRVEEVRTTDAEGNLTTQTTDLNVANATATVTTTIGGYVRPQVEVRLAGLPVSVTALDGLVTTTDYDGLHRRRTVTDSRGNTTTTAYVSATTQPQSITDATNTVVALITYDALGRTVSQAGAPDAAVSGAPRHYTYSSYNTRDQLVHQWGDGSYPVEYIYNSLGERTAMNTYRGGSGWAAADWPGTGSNTSASTGAGDSTIWSFDPATGLLSSKTDADGKAVTYTYNAAGQLATPPMGPATQSQRCQFRQGDNHLHLRFFDRGADCDLV